jgi:uncharacterized protein
VGYLPFVEKLVESVVEHPGEVEIEEDSEMGARTFYIRCHKDDVGKVIGKSGRVVSAIRCVVSAVASKEREKAFVRVIADDE